MTFTDLVPLVTGAGGALVVLLLFLWLFITGRIHSASEFRELRVDRDGWRRMCLGLMPEVEKAVDLAGRQRDAWEGT